MKAKPGFILRNVVDEYILMPTGDNIGQFNGTVLLNEVSAFVWGKLQNPLSKEDLLKQSWMNLKWTELLLPLTLTYYCRHCGVMASSRMTDNR